MPDPSPKKQNRLAEESSPYLLQHADNPVDWYPWGEQAFKKAKQEDKPVFVSIGYATCHWCHVMAHESFEDEEVAAMMNEAFVNIKVDREERPDIDNTYMLVCQMLTGSGGWPLNVLLTPDKKPFYAATYIPKSGRHGRPGMRELIPWISDLWKNEREKVTKSTNEIVNAFQKSTGFSQGNLLNGNILKKAYQQFEQQFDEAHAGFGRAPKFPSAHNLMLLMRYGVKNKHSKALSMVEKTLTRMRMGGIFDHVGLGFHRYSTDRKWLVPHFEKMLYDQAILMLAYTEAWQQSRNKLFRQTAEEIAAYVLNKMQDDHGGFYSAEDADSENEEGKFYVWTVSEIRDILPTADAELAIEIYNLSKRGNYADESSGQRTGKNIPYLTKTFEKLAQDRDMKREELIERIENIRQKLTAARDHRVHPLLDDKILTDWNGLMIAALARAGSAFGNEQYINQSERCWEFIASKLLPEDDNLKHRYRKGDVAIDAHADDYAFLIWGLIELYEATFKTDYLEQAINLNQKFIEEFWDDREGGFFFTSAIGEKLLGRKKEIYDGALPSSNSVAMLNLLRLGRLTGNTSWEEKTDKMNQLFAESIRKAPTGFGFALQSVDFASENSREIIIVGKRDKPDTQNMLDVLRNEFLPNTIVLLKTPDDKKINELATFLSDFDMKNGRATAYVCQNYSCEFPTNDPEKVKELIYKG
ncbi:MAG TPA: thioredoxin domain-containing protein [Balneolaceae bacterium]|nr:thioredoxin domain-containing protein [Balneolaceae bacterium]